MLGDLKIILHCSMAKPTITAITDVAATDSTRRIHVHAIDEVDTSVMPWSVGAQAWGEFLQVIWQQWLADDFGAVFVNQFENTIS